MNKRILSVVLVAFLAVALVIGAVVVSAADDVKQTTEFKTYAERGGNIRLVEPIGLAKDYVIERNLTIDLNGYTLTGNLTVKKGVTLTINDSYTYDANAPHDKVAGTITVQAGGAVVINADVDTVNATGAKDVTTAVTVNGGTVTKVDVSEGAAITVAAGKVGTLTAHGAAIAGKATINGGEITTALKAEAGADVVINGGKVAEITTADKAAVEVNGGEITKIGACESTIYVNAGVIKNIAADADVYVDAAEPYGVIIDYVDKNNSKVNIINGFLNGVSGLKPSDIKGIDLKRTAYVKYTHQYVVTDKKKVTVATDEGYVIGAEIIEKLSLNSGKVQETDADGNKLNGGKETSYTDTVVVMASPKVSLDFTVKASNVSITTVDKYAGKTVYVNGYELGSKVQPGGVIHDWAKTITPVTPVGERDCSKTYVLQAYYADLLNEGVYGKPDADGKLADIYNTAVDKDGPVTGTGHQLKFVSAKGATATAPGYDAYLQCKHCEKCFAVEILTKGGLDLNSVPVKDAAPYEIANPIARNPVDTTAAPADTTKAPADTTAAPAETTAAPAETTAAPAETTAAPETQAPTPVTPSETGDNGMNALVWVIVLGAAITGVAVAGKSVLASKKH